MEPIAGTSSPLGQRPIRRPRQASRRTRTRTTPAARPGPTHRGADATILRTAPSCWPDIRIESARPLLNLSARASRHRMPGRSELLARQLAYIRKDHILQRVANWSGLLVEKVFGLSHVV